MIKNLFLLLVVLLSSGLAYIGFNNKAKHEEQIRIYNSAKSQRAAYNREGNQREEEYNEAEKQLAEANKIGSDREASLEASRSDQGLLERSLAQINAETEGYDDKLNDVQQLIEEVKRLVPDGGSIEEIPDIIANLEEEKEQLSKSLEEKMLLSAKLGKQVGKAQTINKGLDEKLSKIRKHVRMNAVQGRVVSIDQRWGIAVVRGMGSKTGMKGNAKLLVCRGDRYIGRLSIVSLEPNQIVVEVDQESLALGIRVSVGDQVILQDPVVN